MEVVDLLASGAEVFFEDCLDVDEEAPLFHSNESKHVEYNSSR